MKNCLPPTILALFICILAADGLASSTSERDIPNVLIFFVDDMGWSDTEVNGSIYYESPSQLRLAQEGLVLTQAYALPLCSPSRAALLSGQYPGSRFHLTRAITRASVSEPTLAKQSGSDKSMLWPSSRDHMPHDVYTLADALRDQGFQTWHLGKWHLMGKGNDAKGAPKDRGFSKWVGVGGSGPGSYFSPYKTREFPDGPKGEYIGDRMAQEACQLLDNRDKDKPFFMYYACFNVHSPYQAKPDLVKYYEEKLKTMPSENKQNNPVMAAMLHSMDDELKVLLDKLDELKLAENTLVIFTSDNGGCHWLMDKKKSAKDNPVTITSNYPLRGGKCSWFEGGVRVPMIVRWPGKVAVHTQTEYPVHLIDIYPTVLEAIQAKPQNGQILDGQDISPLFAQQTLPERPLYCHFPRVSTTEDGLPGASFVRLGDFKLIRMYGAAADGSDKYLLYNLQDDIGEQQDISADHPEITDQLKKKLNAWLLDTEALVPQPNPAFQAEGK